MKRARHKSSIRTREVPASGTDLRREFELDRAAVNEQARTVELSFSSEVEVERWFGIEILDHSAGAVRLGRLNNGGALLVNHDRHDQVGVVERVSIGADRRGRATVRFGRSARAQEIFQDVVDGIRRLVSVGYRVHRTNTENRPGGVEAVRVVDWEPFEISLVSIPADDSVGVGRGETPPTERNPNTYITMNREQIIAQLRARGIAFDENATDDALRALLTSAPAPAPAPANPPEPQQQRSADPAPAPAPQPAPQAQVLREAPPAPSNGANEAQRAVEAERRRVADLNAIANTVRENGVHVDVQRAIADGVTADVFRNTAFEALVAHQRNYAPGAPGLSRQEQRDLSAFSITRGLSAIMQGRPLDGLEREMHQEAIREAGMSGINLQGNFHIPSVVLTHGRRDMTATGGSNGDQGGSLVATSLGSFIDPSGTPLATGTSAAADVDAEFENVTFTFAKPVDLAAGTYWVALASDVSTHAANNISWRASEVDSGGNASVFNSAWSANTARDLDFWTEVYQFADIPGLAFAGVTTTGSTQVLEANLDQLSVVRAHVTIGGTSTPAYYLGLSVLGTPELP